jgi:hypothetical protein
MGSMLEALAPGQFGVRLISVAIPSFPLIQ